MSRSYLAGLFGQGIGPSLSPELHEREGARQDLRYVYRSIELDDAQLAPERLRALLAHAVELGFDGLNITHPVKHVMTPLVDDLSPGAAAIGAINTVVIRDGSTTGHNTDVTGFAAAVRQGLPDADLDDIVLVGAGGAGTAVAHALADLGAGALHVVDTDPHRAERLLATLGPRHAGRGTTHTPDRLPALLSRASGLVNATPMGMAAHPGSPVEASLLHDRLWVADIVYRPLVTALVQSATERGCRVLTGAGMAVNQAADSFELFTGRPASRAAMVADFDELVAGELQPPGRTA
ncbi:shikimate dehydrogenase [Blastococcus tunisiensis]|uniref:Shikimate dehydrogenase n=1 Tax=Blastococcus tunisiensis TaxID=1798228 RepID=A0A1I2LIC4_9ACTN|nr:shikimate dehydrogenase [Blastococcus sp. DSM 46838]SFF76826.1 shikimate dehydrogenase [Blastococcus sp. DSM 46838]